MMNEVVGAVFHVHEGNEDKLRLELRRLSLRWVWKLLLVRLPVAATVHPLCWHPLPDLPAFITGPEGDEADYIPFNGTD